jgi:hypothetical protein
VTTPLLGWINLIDTGSLLASSEVTGVGVSNLADPHLAVPWQTTGTTAYVLVDSSATGTTWNVFGLFGTNLTSSATVRWQVGNDSTFATSASDSGTVSAGVVAGYGQSVVVPSSTATGRYCRCDITDSTNPDGFLRIGGAYAGPAAQPAIGLAYNMPEGWAAENTVTTSQGGQEFVSIGPQYRTTELTFEWLSPAEKYQIVDEIDRVASTRNNVLFVPLPNDTYMNRQAIYGRLTSLSPAQITSYNRWSKRWAIKERK